MGRKISVDSATLMNKGLEIIEARWLFNALPEQIAVIIHPQSIVHSMVAYRDGSVLAQLGMPDMRTPIAHALAWPERIEAGVELLNLADLHRLEFYQPDLERFPGLSLAFQVLETGGNTRSHLMLPMKLRWMLFCIIALASCKLLLSFQLQWTAANRVK